MPRVAFVTSHPIQYQVPVFQELAQMPSLDLTVFFAQIPDLTTLVTNEDAEPGFTAALANQGIEVLRA